MVKIVPAKNLKKHEIYCNYLDPFIDEQKISINCEINDAHDAGVNIVRHEVPCTIPMPDTFSLKKAQKYVCYKLIRDIEEAGHKTELELADESIVITITWPSKDSEEFQEEIDTVIANRIKKIKISKKKKGLIRVKDARNGSSGSLSRLERSDRDFYFDNVLSRK
jgi:hypothetical protein